MINMNHDSGFIIGIAMIFCQTLIEHTPKSHLKKHLSAKYHPLVVLYNDYRSPSKYQVKQSIVPKTEICHFVHVHVYIHNIIILSQA